ncbi:MAG: hypothetical protein PHE59_01305 [Patescibacteria group bacterium]|nr:hypothetical protein [Patescibacteria group bacterium]MDD5535011.1 hypothetical protein [Patescibacteria group bacterium]
MFEEKTSKDILPEQFPPKEEKIRIEKEKLPEIQEKREESISREEETTRINPLRRHTPIISQKVKEQELLEVSETLKEIEAILSEGMEETYQNLPENLKKQFKEEGRETARKIEKVCSSVKVVIQKILDLIKRWLLIIPAVNVFFLEQEAKIKTDKILALIEKNKKQKIQL